MRLILIVLLTATTVLGQVPAAKADIEVDYNIHGYTGARDGGATNSTVWQRDRTNEIITRMAASESMSENVIRINFVPNASGLPQDVAQILGEIRRSGGDIYVRETVQSMFPGDLLLAIVDAVLPFLVRAIDSWFSEAIAAPTHSFNALLVVDSLAAPQPCFQAVVFYRRGSDEWNEAIAAGPNTPSPLQASDSSLVEGVAVDQIKPCVPLFVAPQ